MLKLREVATNHVEDTEHEIEIHLIEILWVFCRGWSHQDPQQLICNTITTLQWKCIFHIMVTSFLLTTMELWFERTFFRDLFVLRHGFQAINVSKLNLHSPFAGGISNILHGLFPRYLGKYFEFCYDTVRL